MKNVLGAMSRQSAADVYAEMEQTIFTKEDRESALQHDNRATSKHVFDAVCQFLDQSRLVKAGTPIYESRQDNVIGCESFNTDINHQTIGDSRLMDLVQRCKVPAPYQREAMKAVACLIAKMKACNGDNALYRTMHFGHGKRDGLEDATLERNVTTVFAPSLYHIARNIGLPSQESFGANVDKVLPDIRASMAVTLLQFHRGLLDRIMHRRTSASPYVKYVVPYAEVYDMLKSNDKDHMVRNEGEHIIPFIDLYGNPRAVSNILQPIVPLMDNDTEGVLMADGVVKFNARANLFDLSLIANQLGKSHVNYTDLVSENVVLDCVYLKVSNGAKTELFQIPMRQVNGSRYNMTANVVDSGTRSTIFHHTVKLGKDSETTTGAKTELLANCTATDFMKVKMTLAMSINIKYADVEGLGSLIAEAYNKNGAQVAKPVAQLIEGLTVSLEGYTVDARYSEENLRKSNLAIRYNVRTFDFEISNGRNIMIDYSFEEELPEFLMSLVTEATSLGQDHRGIDIIIKELMHVYDVTHLENQDPAFRDRLEKIGFQYISSQLVRPTVYLNTIDLDAVDNIRSGDFMGDIRSYVEWELLNLCSLLYQNSYYKHQLRPGEKPVFKLVTSAVILENIFSIPHYHNHLNNEQTVDGSTVEYRRVLPNGTVLDCVTCTYDYMRDKIFMIPYIENDPESVLNAFSNWDFGTFVAHYNPQLENAVNKRIFSNSRTLPIPQTMVGLYLDVKNLSKFTDMFQLTGNTSGTEALPNPSDILRKEFETALTSA